MGQKTKPEPDNAKKRRENSNKIEFKINPIPTVKSFFDGKNK